MVPLKQGDYTFRRQSIAELRVKLGMSQTQMAERLGVPKNTVSRWERETDPTTPDADYLAAIYSLGMEKGIEVSFFAPRKQKAAPAKRAPAPARDYIIVYWDIGSVTPPNTSTVELWDKAIRRETGKRVQKATRHLFKAFSKTRHAPLTDRLSGWRIWEDETDWTKQITADAHSDTGAEPKRIAFFLITLSVGFVPLIENMKSHGVGVYVLVPTSRKSSLNKKLATAVGKNLVTFG